MDPDRSNFHIKPTKQDLEAQLAAQQAALDAIDNTPAPASIADPNEPPAPAAPPPTPTPPVPPVAPDDEEEDEIDEDEDEVTPATPPAPAAPATPPPPPTPEERAASSFKESMILKQGKEQLEQAIDEAYNTPAPTDEELRSHLQTKGLSLDDLSDADRELWKENLHNKNITDKIKEIREAQKITKAKIEARVAEADVFSIKPSILKKFPSLEGKQADFIKFASKPTRLTLDLEDVARLFLMDANSTKTPNKGQMFELGSGGPNDAPAIKSDKISLADAEVLKKTDWKKYKEYLTAGKIDLEAAG